ncbi:MAG: AAA family ATPase [Chlamydiota bacterium]
MFEIELNPVFQEGLDLLENSKDSIFITGKAGTGKSTLLTYFLENTHKNVVVLAPTGVAALHVKGATIHSFFGFKPGITVELAEKLGKKAKDPSLFQNIDRIIIDEVSMVRSDLLDCIDVFLQKVRKKKVPFGGIPLAFIGDLYQLSPVVKGEEKEYFEVVYASPYFFSANVMKSLVFKFLELEKVYRQKDFEFVELLNALRKNNATEKELEALNARVMPSKDDDEAIYLTSTNALSDEINQKKLLSLPGKMLSFSAEVDGHFGKEIFPTEEVLQLKVGAQVMFLMNHSKGHYVNGTVGKVTQMLDEEIVVQTKDRKEIFVSRYPWTLYKYDFDPENKRLVQEEVGSFTQYPLKLAWGITVHKSQGKTFDRVIVDMKRAFAHGQTYVALSRCRSLEGLFLKYPLKKESLFTDFRVAQFLTQLQYGVSEKKCSKEDKVERIQKAIQEKKALLIVYLKPNDEKSTREVIPVFVGEMTYQSKSYVGMEAFCMSRQEKRVFRVDRILEMSEGKT